MTGNRCRSGIGRNMASTDVIVAKLRAFKDCSEDRDAGCYLDSGPYCGVHAYNSDFIPIAREAADELERLKKAIAAISHLMDNQAAQLLAIIADLAN